MQFQQVSSTTGSPVSTGSTRANKYQQQYDPGLHIDPRRGQPVGKFNHGWEGTPGSPSSTLLPYPSSCSSEGVPSPQHPLHRPPELDGSFLQPSSGDSFSGEFPCYSDSSPQYSPQQRTNHSPGHTAPRVGPTGPGEKGPSRFFQQEGSGYRNQGREVRKGGSDRETGAGKAQEREVRKGVSVQERPAGVSLANPLGSPSSFPCTQEGAMGCRGYQGQSKLGRSLSSDESEGSDVEDGYGTQGKRDLTDNKSGTKGYARGAPSPPYPPQPVLDSPDPWSYDSTSDEDEGGGRRGAVHVASGESGQKLGRSLSDDSDEDDTPTPSKGGVQVHPGSSRPVGPRGGSPPEKLGRNLLEDEVGSPGACKGVRVRGPSETRSPPTKLERKLSDDDEGRQKPTKGERRRVGVRVRSPPQKKLERKLSEEDVIFNGTTTAAVGVLSTSKAPPAMGSPPNKLERKLSDDDCTKGGRGREGEKRRPGKTNSPPEKLERKLSDDNDVARVPTKEATPYGKKVPETVSNAPEAALEGMPMWPYAAPPKKAQVRVRPKESTSPTAGKQRVVAPVKLERTLSGDSEDQKLIPERARVKPKEKASQQKKALERSIDDDDVPSAVERAVRKPVKPKVAVGAANSGPMRLVGNEGTSDKAVNAVRRPAKAKPSSPLAVPDNSNSGPMKLQRDLLEDEAPLVAVNPVRRPVKAKPSSPLAIPDNNSNSGPMKLQRDLLEDEAPPVMVKKAVKQVRQVKQVAGEPLSSKATKSPLKMQRDLCDDDMPRPSKPGRKQVKGALAVGVGVGPTSGAQQYSQSCGALQTGVPQRLGSEDRSSSPGVAEPSKMRKARVRPSQGSSQQAATGGRAAGPQKIERRLSDD